VFFTNLEPVLDLVAGPLTVVGTNGDNAINYTQGSVAANGLVSVDGFETIEFSNKTTLTINALAGSDANPKNAAIRNIESLTREAFIPSPVFDVARKPISGSRHLNSFKLQSA